MTDPLRKAAEGLLACVPEPIGLVGGYTNVPTRCIEALRQALQPTDAGGERPALIMESYPALAAEAAALRASSDDPLATAINRYAGPGRELFEMIYARLRELEGR